MGDASGRVGSLGSSRARFFSLWTAFPALAREMRESVLMMLTPVQGGHVHIKLKSTSETVTPGNNMNDGEHVNILINNQPFKAPRPEMTGREIKELGGGPLDYLLVQVVKDPDPVAGGDDIQIGDGQAVKLKSGMRFRIVNPATFG